MVPSFGMCANAPLHKAALKGQRGERALQILVIHTVSPAAWGPHSHFSACLRGLLPTVDKAFHSLEGELKPKGDLHEKKKNPNKKKERSEILWKGFALNLCEMK